MGFLDKLAKVANEMNTWAARQQSDAEQNFQRGYNSVSPSSLSNQNLKAAYLACGTSAYECGKKKAYAEEMQRRNLRP